MRKAVITKITENRNHKGDSWRVVHFSAKIVWVYKAHNGKYREWCSHCCEDTFLDEWDTTTDIRGLQSGFSQPLHVVVPKVSSLIPKSHLHLTLLKTKSKKKDRIQACQERGLATTGTSPQLYALWKNDVIGDVM